MCPAFISGDQNSWTAIVVGDTKYLRASWHPCDEMWLSIQFFQMTNKKLSGGGFCSPFYHFAIVLWKRDNCIIITQCISNDHIRTRPPDKCCKHMNIVFVVTYWRNLCLYKMSQFVWLSRKSILDNKSSTFKFSTRQFEFIRGPSTTT